MKQIFIVLSFIASAAGVYYPYRDSFVSGIGGGKWGPGTVVSKRDESGDDVKPTLTQEVFDLVKKTSNKASQGISGSDLAEAAVSIEVLCIRYLDSNGLTATDEEVKELLLDVATNLTVDIALFGLFGDRLSLESSHLDAAFQLLRCLVIRAQQLEASGQTCPAAFKAIAYVAQAILKSVDKVSDVIKFLESQAEGQDVKTRDLLEHSLNKRGGKFTLGGHYGGRGDWGVSAGFQWSW